MPIDLTPEETAGSRNGGKMRKLKPCPLCSGDAQSKPDEEMPRWMVECQDCGLVKFAHTEFEAIDAWNQRPDSELERLAREVETAWKEELQSRLRMDMHLTNLPLVSALDALAAYLNKEGTK